MRINGVKNDNRGITVSKSRDLLTVIHLVQIQIQFILFLFLKIYIFITLICIRIIFIPRNFYFTVFPSG